MRKPFALYIHIPYCYQKCPYCDFNTYAVPSVPEAEYTSAILAELDFYAHTEAWKERPVKSIYFGGGTPSLMRPRFISQIIDSARYHFGTYPDAEITLEANPGTVTQDSLVGYQESGVTRLSLGAQSFNSTSLKLLGRMHSVDQVEAAVQSARDADIKNISLDLMFGLPEQTYSELRNDISRALDLEPDHLSFYGLTIEKGTPYYQRYKKGFLRLPPEELVIEMMDEIERVIPSSGLLQYEISNFARAGFQSKHNLAYWSGDDYLGLGAGAHSFYGFPEDLEFFGKRWSNYAKPAKYIEESVAHGRADSWQDSLTLSDGMFEFFFLGLRKICGVDMKDFQSRFGSNALLRYQETVRELEFQGMLLLKDEVLRFTRKGLRLADSVLERFVDPQVERKAV
jgi:oxygen-independent coproporphyrinogen III oxidase